MSALKNQTVIAEMPLETLKLFRIIFKSVNRHFHDVEKAVGIGGASLWALAEVAESDHITVTKLAQNMSIHQSTASNLIDKLVQDGYLVRIKDTNDRRIVHLSLTSQGKDLLKHAPLPHRGILPDALMRLSPASLAHLNQYLSELIATMNAKQRGAAFEPLGLS
jgi:DNA-binding MarR family transcriptional regulator